MGALELKDWMTIAAIIFAGGGIFTIVNSHSRQIKSLHKGLYKDDGTLVYKTAEDCKTDQAGCQSGVSKKIDDLKEDLGDLSKSMDGSLKEITRFMGRVEGYMERNQ